MYLCNGIAYTHPPTLATSTMKNYLSVRYCLFILLLLTFRYVAAQRVAMNDTIYVYANQSNELHVLANDLGADLSIAEVVITLPPTRGILETNLNCNCLIYTPFAGFGTLVYEDRFDYIFVSATSFDQNGGVTTSATNVASVFLLFMEDECDNCVWPGDVNNDGITNAWDLLPIGIAYGTYGMPRSDTSTLWEGHESEDWPGAFGAGALNHKFADCNGDGFINNADVAAIELNYGLTHTVSTIPALPYEANNISLSVQILNESVAIGDTVTANIVVNGLAGDANLYGLAFGINYNIIPVAGTVGVNFPISFFNDGANTISIQRVVSGALEAAITRTNSEFATGNGIVGVISFVMEDVLAGKTTEENLTISLTGVTATSPTGNRISVNTIDGQVGLVLSQQPKQNPELPQFTIYPVPASNQLNLNTAGKQVTAVSLFSNQGKLLQTIMPEPFSPIITIDTRLLAPGLYVLQINTPQGIVTQKVPVVR